MNYLRDIITLKSKVPHKTNPIIETALNLVSAYSGLGGATQRVIGAYGGLVFEVSSEKVRTLRDLKRQSRARYATHDLIGQKSILEFLGLEPDEVSFTVQLNADLGISVSAELWSLLDLLRDGEPQYLVLGGHVYGQGRWALTEMSYTVDYADHTGAPIFATVDMKLKESVR